MYLFEELRPGGCKGENLEAGRPHSSVAKLRRKWRPDHQAPQSLGFSRQEHWRGLPFPPPMHESETPGMMSTPKSLASVNILPYMSEETLHICSIPGF